MFSSVFNAKREKNSVQTGRSVYFVVGPNGWYCGFEKLPLKLLFVLPWLKWRENFVDLLLLKSTIFVWILGETFISCQVYNEGCFQCPVPVESFYRERYIQASKEHEQLRKKLQSQAEQEIEQLTSQKRLLERKVNTKIITWPTRHIIENLAPVWLKPDLTDFY